MLRHSLSLLILVGFGSTSYAAAKAAKAASPSSAKDQPGQSGGMNIQESACVGKPGAPVKAVYLAGWFPTQGSSGGFYRELEAGNRARLTALATKLGIRIAIPLAPKTASNGMRDWSRSSLQTAEFESLQACHSPLAKGRTLIGFSAGGYAARNIALSCNAHLRSEYSTVIMSGAKATGTGGGKGRYSGCPKLVATRGLKDGSVGAFTSTAGAMKNGYGNVDISSYPGGHGMPPDQMLAQYIAPPLPTAKPLPTAFTNLQGPVTAGR